MNYKIYRKELKNVLMTGNLDEFKKFCKKHKKYIGYKTIPPNDILEISMHKIRVHDTSLPKDIRVESAEWLISREFSPNIR